MKHIETFTSNELQLVVTARKIRQFKEIIAQQRTLGAADEQLTPSLDMLQRLEQDFKHLGSCWRLADTSRTTTFLNEP